MTFDSNGVKYIERIAAECHGNDSLGDGWPTAYIRGGNVYDDTIDLGTSEGRQHALELSRKAQLPFAVSMDYLDTRKRKIDFDLEGEERELARLARVRGGDRKNEVFATSRSYTGECGLGRFAL